MAGKFERKRFSDINLNDPFFDSLKRDYPGNENSAGFIEWFNRKASEGKKALVFEDEQGVGAFINLKPGEIEEIELQDGRVLPNASRMKITTIKIDDRYRGKRIGEGAIGLTLWHWQQSGENEIYVTTFAKQDALIALLQKYGFEHVGNNLNGEYIFIKDRRHLDFSDPCKAFPFLSNSIEHAGLLIIDMDYHDTMFAYSELANTIQERVDLSVANGLKKVYIGNGANVGFREGEPVFIYRKFTGTGQKGFKSVITGYCIATKIQKIRSGGRPLVSYEEFMRMIGNKSVFDEFELRTKYETSSTLMFIELLYYGYFGSGNNVNWMWLKDNGCMPDGVYPMSIRYTRDEFERILKEGNVDVSNVIVD